MLANAKRGPLFAVPTLDLSRLRDMAFGAAPPDHPLRNEAEVQKMIAGLPADPVAGLGELAHWAVSINQTDAFSSEHRARIFMAMDAAAHDHWRRVCNQHLAPGGTPAEGRDVDGAGFRLLLEITTEFAKGYAASLAGDAAESGWIRKNLAPLMLRRTLWLARRFTLANALHQPNAASMWEEAHAMYTEARDRQVLELAQRPSPAAPATSIRQEYVRLLLLDIAGQDTMSSREIELATRIAGQVAASARLEPEAIPEALYAVVPEGTSRPTLVRRLKPGAAALYLDTSRCLPHLQALLNREASNPAEPDAMFGREFTHRESSEMADRLMEYWGPNPPKRRSQRVALDAIATIRCGFDGAVQMFAALDQGVSLRDAAASAARAQADADKQRGRAPKTVPETRARLADASAAGLGLLVPRKEAGWARLGVLLAIHVEPGPDWIVAALRRISAEGDMLRLGVRILARRPRSGWFHLETDAGAEFADENRTGNDFLEFYQRGILLDADVAGAAGAGGEMLLPHGVARADLRLDFPGARSIQHVMVTAVREATRGFDRIAFEVLGETPRGMDKIKTKSESSDGPDPWKFAV